MEEAPGPPVPPKALAIPGPPLLRGTRNRQQEGEAPDAHIAEEGKRVIRELVARQTDVTLSLQQQQSREREFTPAAPVLPLSRVVSGAASLRDFTAAAERVTRCEERVRAQARAALGLQERSPQAPVPAGSSRHLDELASTLRPDGAHSQFVRLGLAGAAAAAATDVQPPAFRESASRLPEHPMQRLHCMERALRPPEEPPAPAATSRKRRRIRKTIEKLKEGDSLPPPTPAAGGSGAAGGSLWDVRVPVTSPVPKVSPRAAGARRALGPHRPKQYTIRDGQIVEVGSDATAHQAHPPGGSKGQRLLLTGAAGCVTVEELRSNRLSLEEIRQLPKFANYEAGTPSATLYVKNLSNDVTEEDLAGVFGVFRKPSGTSPGLRLCGGRMRGQAFVTFPNVDDAREALGEVNGYRLKGRPMIVQYARNQSCS